MARLLLAASLAFAVVVSAQPLYAGDMMHRMAGEPGMGPWSMTMPPMDGSCPTPGFFIEHRDDIGLSDAQVADIRKLDFELKRRKITMGAQVRALELELTEIVTGPDFTVEGAVDKLGEIEKARTELRTGVVKTYGKLRASLDTGQLDKLGRLLATMSFTVRKRPEGPITPSPVMDKDMIKRQMMKQMMEKEMP